MTPGLQLISAKQFMIQDAALTYCVQVPWHTWLAHLIHGTNACSAVM